MNDTIKKPSVSASNTAYGTIYHQDCLEGLRAIPDASIDLILTDPPYLIKDTHAGGGQGLQGHYSPLTMNYGIMDLWVVLILLSCLNW